MRQRAIVLAFLSLGIVVCGVFWTVVTDSAISAGAYALGVVIGFIPEPAFRAVRRRLMSQHVWARVAAAGIPVGGFIAYLTDSVLYLGVGFGFAVGMTCLGIWLRYLELYTDSRPRSG
jgi:hypothetical protein